MLRVGSVRRAVRAAQRRNMSDNELGTLILHGFARTPPHVPSSAKLDSRTSFCVDGMQARRHSSPPVNEFMTIRFNPRWLFVSVLLFSLQFCRAQITVPPTVSFDLGDSNAPETQLWDLGGAYTLDFTVTQNNGIAVPVELTIQVLQDAAGKLVSPTNDNTEFLQVNADDNSIFAVSPKVTGKVTSASPGVARVHMSIRFTGSGTMAGQPVDSLSGSLTVDAETDPTTGLLFGTKIPKFSASFQGAGNISGKVFDFSTPMPDGADATWNLSLNIAPLKKIGGTAIITTPNRSLGMDLSGSFKNAEFKLTAKGAGDVPNTANGTGSKAKILLPESVDSIDLFSGKVLGQKLVFSTSPQPD